MNSLLIHLPPQIWIICLPPSWHDTIVKCEDLTTTVSKIIPDIRPLACSVFTRQSPVCSNASLFANLDFRLNTGEHIHFLFARNVICKSVTIRGGEILAPTRYCLVLSAEGPKALISTKYTRMPDIVLLYKMSAISFVDLILLKYQGPPFTNMDWL